MTLPRVAPPALQRISAWSMTARGQVLCIVLAICLGMGLSHQLWWPAWQQWQQAQEALERMRLQQAQIERLKDIAQQLSQRLEAQQQQIPDLMQARLATAQLKQKAKALGLQTHEVQVLPSSEADAQGWSQYELQLSFSGPWHAWQAWFAQLAAADLAWRLKTIEFVPEGHQSVRTQLHLSLPLWTAASPAGPSAANPMNASERRLQPLEQYARQNMTYVGRVWQQGRLHALLEVALDQGQPMVYSAEQGAYLGKDFGQIVAIEKEVIVVRELVMDQVSGWVKREVLMPLGKVGS